MDIEMNPFAKYGIEHLSPSQCNLFVASPAMYVMERCMKLRSPVGAAAHRGTAVEAGVVHGLLNGATLKECQDLAKKEFDKLTALSGDPRKEKEAAGLADMVAEGIKELSAYGKPTSTQGAIKYEVEGLAVPLIGFYDMEWENHGILIDLKTTHALPSKISTNHARQVALYCAARGDNLDARITYVTSKKSATYQLENKREHVKALETIALTIQRFLSISDDPKYLASLVVPDVDSFYFSDPLARQNAFNVWGL
jgi:hypothetical protein